MSDSNPKSISDLWRATKNSPGLDLCSTTSTILTPEEGAKLLQTGIRGPLPPNTFGLILGCTSASLKGLQIHPGVIDPDFKGDIQILASTLKGPLYIPEKTTLAQLLLLPLIPSSNKYLKEHRETGDIGTTDVYWAQQITRARPMLTLSLNGKAFQGLLDSGADATVTAKEQWPSSWPLTDSTTHLQGIGQSQNPQVSSQSIHWSDQEGNSGTVIPFVIPKLPVNLWG